MNKYELNVLGAFVKAMPHCAHELLQDRIIIFAMAELGYEASIKEDILYLAKDGIRKQIDLTSF